MPLKLMFRKSIPKISTLLSLLLFATNCVFAYSLEINLLPALPKKYGTIRNTTRGPSDKTIIHIQDIHENLEAQTHISQTIQNLIKTKKVDMIALEGAFGPIDLSLFRNFPDKNALRLSADYLLKEKVIGGPVHAALTHSNEIPFLIGIDDSTSYKANVKAVQDATPLKEKAKEKWQEEEIQLSVKKRKIFNSDLADFDSTVQAYRKGKIRIGSFLKTLQSYPESDFGLNIHLFLETLELERSLDLNRVQCERSLLLSKLLKKLPSSQSKALFQKSLSYQKGQLGHSDFYQYLENLCTMQKIPFDQYKSLKSYHQYLLLSENIKAEPLFGEMKKAEKRVYDALIQTKQEKELVQQSDFHHLKGKLLDFSLTKEEWEEYKRAKIENGELLDPFSIFHFPFSTFEAFYRYAETRDNAMATNLMNAMDEQGAKVAILVTGGFHTKGIQEQLSINNHQFSYVEYVPKITKVTGPTGTTYLSVFTQEKTPLDKLFEGEKLFLVKQAWILQIRTHLSILMGSLSPRNAKKLIQKTLPTLKAWISVTKQKLEDGLTRSLVTIQGQVGVLATAADYNNDEIKRVARSYRQRETDPTLIVDFLYYFANEHLKKKWGIHRYDGEAGRKKYALELGIVLEGFLFQFSAPSIFKSLGMDDPGYVIGLIFFVSHYFIPIVNVFKEKLGSRISSPALAGQTRWGTLPSLPSTRGGIFNAHSPSPSPHGAENRFSWVISFLWRALGTFVFFGTHHGVVTTLLGEEVPFLKALALAALAGALVHWVFNYVSRYYDLSFLGPDPPQDPEKDPVTGLTPEEAGVWTAIEGQVRAYLVDTDPQDRRYGLEIVGDSAPKTRENATTLLEAFSDPDHTVRQGAAHAFARFDYPDELDLLISYIENPAVPDYQKDFRENHNPWIARHMTRMTGLYTLRILLGHEHTGYHSRVRDLLARGFQNLDEAQENRIRQIYFGFPEFPLYVDEPNLSLFHIIQLTAYWQKNLWDDLFTRYQELVGDKERTWRFLLHHPGSKTKYVVESIQLILYGVFNQGEDVDQRAMDLAEELARNTLQGAKTRIDLYNSDPIEGHSSLALPHAPPDISHPLSYLTYLIIQGTIRLKEYGHLLMAWVLGLELVEPPDFVKGVVKVKVKKKHEAILFLLGDPLLMGGLALLNGFLAYVFQFLWFKLGFGIIALYFVFSATYGSWEDFLNIFNVFTNKIKIPGVAEGRATYRGNAQRMEALARAVTDEYFSKNRRYQGYFDRAYESTQIPFWAIAVYAAYAVQISPVKDKDTILSELAKILPELQAFLDSNAAPEFNAPLEAVIGLLFESESFRDNLAPLLTFVLSEIAENTAVEPPAPSPKPDLDTTEQPGGSILSLVNFDDSPEENLYRINREIKVEGDRLYKIYQTVLKGLEAVPLTESNLRAAFEAEKENITQSQERLRRLWSANDLLFFYVFGMTYHMQSFVGYNLSVPSKNPSPDCALCGEIAYPLQKAISQSKMGDRLKPALIRFRTNGRIEILSGTENDDGTTRHVYVSVVVEEGGDENHRVAIDLATGQIKNRPKFTIAPDKEHADFIQQELAKPIDPDSPQEREKIAKGSNAITLFETLMKQLNEAWGHPILREIDLSVDPMSNHERLYTEYVQEEKKLTQLFIDILNSLDPTALTPQALQAAFGRDVDEISKIQSSIRRKLSAYDLVSHYLIIHGGHENIGQNFRLHFVQMNNSVFPTAPSPDCGICVVTTNALEVALRVSRLQGKLNWRSVRIAESGNLQHQYIVMELPWSTQGREEWVLDMSSGQFPSFGKITVAPHPIYFEKLATELNAVSLPTTLQHENQRKMDEETQTLFFELMMKLVEAWGTGPEEATEEPLSVIVQDEDLTDQQRQALQRGEHPEVQYVSDVLNAPTKEAKILVHKNFEINVLFFGFMIFIAVLDPFFMIADFYSDIFIPIIGLLINLVGVRHTTKWFVDQHRQYVVYKPQGENSYKIRRFTPTDLKTLIPNARKINRGSGFVQALGTVGSFSTLSFASPPEFTTSVVKIGVVLVAFSFYAILFYFSFYLNRIYHEDVNQEVEKRDIEEPLSTILNPNGKNGFAKRSTDENLFFPNGRLYETPETAPLPVRFEVSEEAIGWGLTEETIQTLAAVASRMNPQQAHTVQSAYSLYFELPANQQLRINGEPYPVIELYGTAYHGNLPQAAPHPYNEGELARARVTARTVLSNGEIFGEPIPVQPKGAFLQNARAEHNNRVEAGHRGFQNGPYPIGIGQYTTLNLGENPMGFQIRALKRVPENTIRSQAAWVTLHGRSHDEFESASRTLVAQSAGLGRTLRSLHHVGITLRSNDLDDFEEQENGNVWATRFDQGLSVPDINREQFIFWVIMEFAMAFNDVRYLEAGLNPNNREIGQSATLPDSNHAWYVTRLGLASTPTRAFLSAYFTQEELDQMGEKRLEEAFSPKNLDHLTDFLSDEGSFEEIDHPLFDIFIEFAGPLYDQAVQQYPPPPSAERALDRDLKTLFRHLTGEDRDEKEFKDTVLALKDQRNLIALLPLKSMAAKVSLNQQVEILEMLIDNIQRGNNRLIGKRKDMNGNVQRRAEALQRVLHPSAKERGNYPIDVIQRLKERFPGGAIHVKDVGVSSGELSAKTFAYLDDHLNGRVDQTGTDLVTQLVYIFDGEDRVGIFTNQGNLVQVNLEGRFFQPHRRTGVLTLPVDDGEAVIAEFKEAFHTIEPNLKKISDAPDVDTSYSPPPSMSKVVVINTLHRNASTLARSNPRFNIVRENAEELTSNVTPLHLAILSNVLSPARYEEFDKDRAIRILGQVGLQMEEGGIVVVTQEMGTLHTSHLFTHTLFERRGPNLHAINVSQTYKSGFEAAEGKPILEVELPVEPAEDAPKTKPMAESDKLAELHQALIPVLPRMAQYMDLSEVALLVEAARKGRDALSDRLEELHLRVLDDAVDTVLGIISESAGTQGGGTKELMGWLLAAIGISLALSQDAMAQGVVIASTVSETISMNPFSLFMGLVLFIVLFMFFNQINFSTITEPAITNLLPDSNLGSIEDIDPRRGQVLLRQDLTPSALPPVPMPVRHPFERMRRVQRLIRKQA